MGRAESAGKREGGPIWIVVHGALSFHYATGLRTFDVIERRLSQSINQSINKSIVDALQADVHRGASSRRT